MKISEETIEEMRKHRSAGFSIARISDKFHVNHVTVSKYVSDIKVEFPLRNKLSDSKIAEMRKMRNDGLSISKISDDLKFSKVTVSKYCKDINTSNVRGRSSQFSDDQIAEMRKMRAEGRPYEEIARVFKCSRPLIFYRTFGCYSVQDRMQRRQSMIKEYVKQGKTVKEISELSGIKINSLRTYVKIARNELSNNHD